MDTHASHTMFPEIAGLGFKCQGISIDFLNIEVFKKNSCINVKCWADGQPPRQEV